MTFAPGGSPVDVAAHPAEVTSRGLWSLLGYGAASVSTLAASIIVARSLGVASVGRYSYAIWVLRVVPALLALGVPLAITRFVSAALGTGDTDAARATFVVARRFHLALLPLPVVAATWAAATGRSPVLVAASIAVGVAIALLMLDYDALLAGLRRFRTLSTQAIVAGAAQVLLAFVAFALGLDWVGFTVMFVIANAAGLIVLVVPARRALHEMRGGGRGVLDRAAFARYAGVVAITGTIDAVLWGRPELLFLQRYRSDLDLGYYSAALRLASLAGMLPLVASRVLLPEFSFHSADRQKVQRTFTLACIQLTLLTVPAALVGAVLAPALLVTVFGAEFAPAGTATTILLAGSVVNVLVGPTAAAVLTGPRPRIVVEVGVVAVVVNLALAVALIPSFGPIGAAAANVAVQTLSVAAGVVYARVWMQLRYPVAAMARLLVAAVVAAVAAGLINSAITGVVGILAAASGAAAIYLTAVLVLRLVPPEALAVRST